MRNIKKNEKNSSDTHVATYCSRYTCIHQGFLMVSKVCLHYQ